MTPCDERGNPDYEALVETGKSLVDAGKESGAVGIMLFHVSSLTALHLPPSAIFSPQCCPPESISPP